MADVLDWQERDAKVQLYAEGKAAVVTYEYTVRCRMKGAEVELEGRDMMVLVEEQGRWWLVADQFSGLPPA